MTNITAVVVLVVSTNWITVSRESPMIAPGHAYDAVMRYNTLHQRGARVTNTVAIFEWNGKPMGAVLESSRPYYDDALRRDISESFEDQWNNR